MDRRTKYTKNIIKETFINLLEKKELNKITVSEICKIADINRSTFYRYYLDVYDLLSYTPDNNYMLESNIDSIPDGNEKDYFNELIQLIASIITELNNLNSSDDETIELNSDEVNTKEENERLDVENNDSINFDDFLS